MNFTRPKIYISKKEDIEKLKKDFIDNGYTSLSRYFNELIMLDINTSIWMEVCI